jgi:hypothetical protein
MGLKAIHTFAAATNSYLNTVKTLSAIQQARHKQEQDDQMFEINKKKSLLDLDAARVAGRLNNAEADFEEQKLKYNTNQIKKVNEAKNILIDQEEHKNTQALNYFGTIMKSSLQDPDVMNYVTSGQITPAKDQPNPVQNFNPRLPRQNDSDVMDSMDSGFEVNKLGLLQPAKPENDQELESIQMQNCSFI